MRSGKYLLKGVIYQEEGEYFHQCIERMRDNEVKEDVPRDKLIKGHKSLKTEGLGDLKDQNSADMHRISQGPRTLGRFVSS